MAPDNVTVPVELATSVPLSMMAPVSVPGALISKVALLLIVDMPVKV